MPLDESQPLVLELRVAITTKDFDQLASFYRLGLGLQPAQEWPADQGRALVLHLGRATLEIFDEQQSQTVDQVEVGHPISGRVRFALQVPDLESAMGRLVSHGAKMVHPPVITPWGDTTVRFVDSDGMQITIYQAAEQP